MSLIDSAPFEHPAFLSVLKIPQVFCVFCVKLGRIYAGDSDEGKVNLCCIYKEVLCI